MGDPGNPEADKTESSIEKAAEGVLGSRPLITNKEIVPPSGDKRDYVSLSPYHYLTANGEYEYRDGQRNPKADKYPDSDNLIRAIGNVLLTSLAAESAKNPGDKAKFASQAISTLKDWFVNEETRMTPSLEYSEMREGETTGNWYGVIEGKRLIYVIDGVKRLKDGGFIDDETLEGVKKWFGEYLGWLQESEKGKQAKESDQNQGTFYDVQVAYIADFLGREDLARATFEGAKKRIESQIEPDGRMPLEIQRAIPYDYQLYNLFAFSELATLGQKYKIDLWNWQTENGRGLRKAFEYFEKQLAEVGESPFKMNRSGELYLAFRAASRAYNNINYWSLPGRYYKDPLADEISARKFRRG